MSGPVDPWEGVPRKWRNALAVYGLYMDEQSRDNLAALLREAAADQARLDWLSLQLQGPKVDGEIQPIGDIALSGSWTCVTLEVGNGFLKACGPNLRECIDVAISSLPPEEYRSPTPTKE